MALAPVIAQVGFASMQQTLQAMGADVRVLSYSVDEGLSKPFAIDVVLHILVPAHIDETPLRSPRAWLAQPALFTLSRPTVPARQWLGMVGSCTVLQGQATQGVSLSMSLVPRLQLLAHHIGSEAYIGHSVAEIVRRLVADALGPTGSIQFMLADPVALDAALEVHFRYRESRLDCLHRLLRHTGLGYWLTCKPDDHGAPQPALVVFDNPAALLRDGRPHGLTIPMSRSGALDQESFDCLADSETLGPSEVHVTALDATQVAPHTIEGSVAPQVASEGSGVVRIVASDLRREFRGTTFVDSAHEQRARALAHELAGRATAGTQASGNALSAAPGRALRIVGHPELWMATAMCHSGGDGADTADGADPADPSLDRSPKSYTCSVDLVPIDTQAGVVRWQGATHTAPAAPMGMQGATVVGPEGATHGPASVDDSGRVLVQLHGMDHCVPDHAAMVPAFPVRVGQFWAGEDIGAFFWPRPGMEVVVGFVGTEGCEPIIMGSLYNAHNTSPHPYLMAERVGIRGCKGGNEVSFFEGPGREELHISALRTLKIDSQELMTTQVGFKNLLRRFVSLSKRLQALVGSETAPKPSTAAKAWQPVMQQAGDVLTAAASDLIDGKPISGPTLQTVQDKFKDWEKASEPLLVYGSPAVRKAIKSAQRYGHTLVSALAVARGGQQSRIVSKTKIYGKAQTDITGSSRLTIDAHADVTVGKKLSVSARTATLTAQEAVVMRQSRMGQSQPSALVLDGAGSKLDGQVVRLSGSEAITLVQQGAKIVLENGEITITAAKINLNGQTIAIKGSQGVTIKSPNTKIY